MSARIALLILLLAVAPAVGPAAQDARPSILAFVNARIIDGAGGAPIRNGAMVVQDGRITAIGPMPIVRIPAEATRVNVAGRTMMPGMINAHGHVGDVARSARPSRSSTPPSTSAHQLALYARYGVTTVFSLGGDGPAGVQVRDEKGAGPRARLFVAGPVIATADPDGGACGCRWRQGDERRHREDSRRRQSRRGKEDAGRGLSRGDRAGACALA